MAEPKLSLDWAHKIIDDWISGQYPAKYQAAYEFACKAVGIEPRPHPEWVRKSAYRADVDS